MRFLIVSDLHAHDAWPMSQTLESGRSDRFQDLLTILEQVRLETLRTSYDALLILGDVTHRRAHISFKMYNTLVDAIAALWTEQPVHILVGNHDLENARDSSLHPLSYIPGITVYERPTVAELAKGVKAHMIPFTANAPEIGHLFRTLDPALPVFAHYAAEGCPLETDYWLDSPIKLGDCDRFPQVVFGHVHKPGTQLDGKITYVGAPLHFDFGDHGPRYLWKWEDGVMTCLPLNGPVFVTGTYPRIPMAPAVGGYLRLQNVPLLRLEDVKAHCLSLGWRDARVEVEWVADGTVMQLLDQAEQAGGVTEQLLTTYIQSAHPEWSDAVQQQVLARGLQLLEEVRS